MKTSLILIIKIELMKFFRKFDIIATFGIVCIGLIFAVNMTGEGYTGAENQNALYWVTIQSMTATVLFVAPIVMSFIGTQMLSSEIDNNTISLFLPRVRNRKRLYLGKSIALIIISTLVFVLSVVLLFAIYFFFTPSNSIYVSGELFGNNIGTMDGVKYFNPMYYMVRLANDVGNTTALVSVGANETAFCMITQLVLCFAYCFLFVFLGMRSFKARDL